MRLISADGRWWWNAREWKPLPKAVDVEAGEDAPADAEHPAPAEPPPVAPDNGNRRFMPGRYVKSRTEVPGTGIACRLYELSGGIFDWTLISRVADEEILALTGEVATGFSLGRSIPGAVEPA
jgi:hypothetical protein